MCYGTWCHLIKERGEKGNGWRGVLFAMGEVIEVEDVNKDNLYCTWMTHRNNIVCEGFGIPRVVGRPSPENALGRRSISAGHRQVEVKYIVPGRLTCPMTGSSDFRNTIIVAEVVDWNVFPIDILRSTRQRVHLLMERGSYTMHSAVGMEETEPLKWTANVRT